MKVLISAYVCEPNSSSEAEVGWQWVNYLSKFHELVIITKRPQPLQNVEKFIKENKNLRFEYYDLPKIFDFMRTGDIRHFIYYNLWQIGAYFHAKKLVKKEKFDLVHHLVYVNTWQPTYMAFLGIPFIYGPIGENPRVPHRIIKYYGWKTSLRDSIISYARYVSKNFNPLVRKIYHRASRIIVINNEIYSGMEVAIKEKTYIMPAGGVFLPDIDLDNKITENNNKFMILYVGRFIYIKALILHLKLF